MARKIPSYAERLKWFHKARFGMFIHFGLYSLLERGEWVMLQERIATDEYAKLADRFNPQKFDANTWASLAAEAGMKYMVLTTRHHDGFCLFDSKVSDFTSAKTAAKRDFVAEYVRACREAGLKVGLYYSLLDWRFPGYFEPVKYKSSAKAMVQQAHNQVRELMTNYGKIDILWYDGCWVNHPSVSKGGEPSQPTAEYLQLMANFWQSKKLNAMARQLQPNIIINNRAGTAEDLDTPEQHVTASTAGRGWESNMTIGDHCGWGYVRNSPNFKTVPQLLQNLVIAAKGEGNYLLNVGPKPDGTIRSEEIIRLRAMGKWLKTNGEAIYGSQRCELLGGGDNSWNPIWLNFNMLGVWTRKGKIGYLHIFRWPGSEAVIPSVKSKALSATVLETGRRAKIRQEYNGRLVIYDLPRKPPNPYITVIKIRFAEEPKLLKERNRATWLDGKGY